MDATVPEDDAGRPIRTHVRAYLSDKSSVIVFLAALLAFAGITVSGVGTSAAADPSADDWYRLRVCESGNNYAINTGNGYYGAYQFDLGTWGSVGGSGYPNQASPETQDALALRLWQQRGWGPWACARILGLTGSPSDSPRHPRRHRRSAALMSSRSPVGAPPLRGGPWTRIRPAHRSKRTSTSTEPATPSSPTGVAPT